VEKTHSLIFLTGFSGSGKSSIGPLLANSLGYDFIDIDSAIEKQAGKPITRIFADDGEAAFRELELAMIKTVAGRTDLVVSLGGGALENNPSFELVTDSGTLVYLKSDPKNLAKRLFHKKTAPCFVAAALKNQTATNWNRKSTRFLKTGNPATSLHPLPLLPTRNGLGQQ